MKQALILGCSHAAGSEIIDKSYNRTNVNPVLLSKRDDAYGRDNSYPVLLAQRLGHTAMNYAIPGGSNDAMFRIFQEQCHNYNMVIACWTGIDRTELWNSENHAWFPMAHGVVLGHQVRSDLQEYGRHWAVHEGTQQRGHLNKTKNILALNMLAQSRNISVINIDSFQPVDWPDRMQWPNSMFWPVADTTFCNWARQQKFSHNENGHFDRDAHSAFADYVLKNIAN
jgi:hypothetical protein